MYGKLINQQSPHETDLRYVLDIVGPDNPELVEFASSKQMALDLTMTNFARSYNFKKQRFIQDEIAPTKGVASKLGQFKGTGKEELDVHGSDIISDTGKTNEASFEVTETPYFVESRGRSAFISDDVIQERGAIDPMRRATIFLLGQVKRRQEIRIRNLADATVNTITPVTDWDTTATLFSDIAQGKILFENTLGLPATDLVLPSNVAEEILANSTAGTNMTGAIATAMAIADGRKLLEVLTIEGFPMNAWGFRRVHLPNAQYNSSLPGLPVVPTRIWNEDAFLFHIDNETESSTWAMQPMMLDFTVITYRDESRGTTGGVVVKVVTKRDEIEVTPEAILKFVDVT